MVGNTTGEFFARADDWAGKRKEKKMRDMHRHTTNLSSLAFASLVPTALGVVWSSRFISLMSVSCCMPDFIRRQLYYDFSQNNLAIRKGPILEINKFIRTSVGADLSRPPPIYRPSADVLPSGLF